MRIPKILSATLSFKRNPEKSPYINTSVDTERLTIY